MINLKKPANLLFTLCAVIVIFGLGFNFGKEYNETKFTQKIKSYSAHQKTSVASQDLDFSLFWSVWDHLDSKFVSKEKLDPKLMYYGAIKGMVASLDDPYTFFLSPDENKQSKDDLGGLFEGIGAQLGMRDGNIIVVAPLKNSPAQRAGVMSGDIIIKVNNDSTANWTIQKAVSKIRGEKGTKVTLTILRSGKEKKFTIIREEIKVPSTEVEYRQDVAILKLNRFGDDTNSEWDKQVTEINQKWQNKEIKGMVLDMRDNPGGFLQSAIYISSEFLEKEKIVVKQEYKDKRKSETFTVTRDGKLLDIPLVVLINGGSASASEIVAGALRDHKRARLLGVKSFGKGSIQEALDLDTGAGLHVTIAKWVLPNGDWINGTGIKPDVEVKNETPDYENTPTKEQDNQLDKAIETVLK